MPPHGAVQRAPLEILSFHLCNIGFVARYFVTAVGEASSSPERLTYA